MRPDLCAVRNDVAPREYLGKFWIDSLVHSEPVLRYLVELIGSKRIALGTDYPFPLGELSPGKLIESSDLPDATKEDLLANAALEWLGLDKEQFQR